MRAAAPAEATRRGRAKASGRPDVGEIGPGEGARPLEERRRRLRTTLEEARAHFPGPPLLREAVAAYVGDLREAGHPPERVLVDVKALLAEIGFPRRAEDRALGPREQVVRWVIQEYYRSN